MPFSPDRPAKESPLMSVAQTSAPSAAIASAVARPMPWPAAVTSARLFASRPVLVIPNSLLSFCAVEAIPDFNPHPNWMKHNAAPCPFRAL